MKYGAGEDIRSRYYSGVTGAAGDVGAGMSGFARLQMGQQGVDEDELFDMIKGLTPEQREQFLKMWGF